MDLIKLAKVEDFNDRKIKSFFVIGKKIGIVKREDGTFYATEVGCKHQGADITRGKIENNIATCPRHGWQYDLETGACLNHDSPPLRKFELKIEDDAIKVSIIPIE